jgi:dihydrofolate synthase/folylpolyglutamate synthase
VSSVPSNADVAWLESLELFGWKLGLERMEALLERLGRPERRFRAIHVVGTNGKTTVARKAEALLLAEGVATGAYISPHVTGWAERIRIGGAEADLDRALARVRPAAEEVGATQFEVLTAAAFAEFAAAGVDVAVVEAGLGGRLDATNVLAAPVVVLTNVGLDHTEHLGATREAIAGEKLAVLPRGGVLVTGEADWTPAARALGAARAIVANDADALAREAVAVVLGRAVGDPPPVSVPGRLEHMGERPLEIWDGAHNPAGVDYLTAHLPPRDDWTLVLSILADKDVEAMLARFARLGARLVATSSGAARALPAADLARRGRGFFTEVDAVEDPAEARDRARALAGADGAVLLSGSLTLIASLAVVRPASVR